MILYYAMGGGMGHLVRASAFIYTFGFTDIRILTSSSFAGRIFEEKDIIFTHPDLQKSPAEFLNFLQSILKKLPVDALYLDCFSAGILGEIRTPKDILNIPLFYVTRYMRWDRYRDKVSQKLRFKKSYILEDLDPAHQVYVETGSEEIWTGNLNYPTTGVPDKISSIFKNNKIWLVVHSGPVEETELLIAHAQDVAATEHSRPQIYVISPVEISGYKNMDFYPASSLFPLAERIFSGCGFNIMKQTEGYNNSHIFIPFERKYDDQFRRAERAKKNRPH